MFAGFEGLTLFVQSILGLIAACGMVLISFLAHLFALVVAIGWVVMIIVGCYYLGTNLRRKFMYVFSFLDEESAIESATPGTRQAQTRQAQTRQTQTQTQTQQTQQTQTQQALQTQRQTQQTPQAAPKALAAGKGAGKGASTKDIPKTQSKGAADAGSKNSPGKSQISSSSASSSQPSSSRPSSSQPSSSQPSGSQGAGSQTISGSSKNNSHGPEDNSLGSDASKSPDLESHGCSESDLSDGETDSGFSSASETEPAVVV